MLEYHLEQEGWSVRFQEQGEGPFLINSNASNRRSHSDY